MVLTLTTYALSFKENHQHLNMEESFTPFQNKEEKNKKKRKKRKRRDKNAFRKPFRSHNASRVSGNDYDHVMTP